MDGRIFLQSCNAVCGSKPQLGLSKRNHFTLQADTVSNRPCLLHLQIYLCLSSTVQSITSLCKQWRCTLIVNGIIRLCNQPAACLVKCISYSSNHSRVIETTAWLTHPPKSQPCPFKETPVCESAYMHMNVYVLPRDWSHLDLCLTQSALYSKQRHKDTQLVLLRPQWSPQGKCWG